MAAQVRNHERLPDSELSHVRRFRRFMDLETADPLRMLAVAIVSMAEEDARRGQHVVMGIEWVYALEVPARWLDEIGVELQAA